jgi:hypothetical protein
MRPAGDGEILPVLLRDEPAGEVERRPGDMSVNVHPAGEDDHPGGVDGPAAVDVGDDLAAGDANVADRAVDVVRRVVDFAAGDAKHGESAGAIWLSQGR